ncbi:MAG: YihY/virulence factor BrkB family protein [Bacteroidales bacterium]|nr:YihY/virulence factor BrkB family protein [Bacteroidales bacterium]
MEEKSDLSKISLFVNKKAKWAISRAKQISLPGFESIPIYDVVVFFIRGIQRGALTTRASSIAFHFALASLPLIIYLFTLIPHIPINNFQEGFMSMVESMLPSNVFQLLESTLRDMFIKRRALQLLGILIALYFATNAINVLIVAFNNTYHAIETRSWMERRTIAAFLVIIMFVLMVTAISLIIFSRSAINLLEDKEIIQKGLTLYIFRIGKWIVIIALIYSALSFLYWLGPSRKMKWKFYSAGSSLASVLVILTSLIFSFIINNFGQFNKFYGSIGTLMVILLWLYLNSIALLIGFELNASIKGAKLVMDNEMEEEITEDG